jgi:hypothetical protein
MYIACNYNPMHCKSSHLENQLTCESGRKERRGKEEEEEERRGMKGEGE